MRKFVAIVLLITLVTGLCGAVTAIETDENAARVMYTSGGEEKVYCNATIEDDFAENRVMVVLSNEASLKFDTYGADDFSGINCAAVCDMSQASGAKIQAKVAEVKEAAVSRSISLETVDVSGIDTYNQVLCLELEENGKDNVLAVIDELMQRDDVIYAGPDYAITLCTTTPDDGYYDHEDNWAPDVINLPEAWDITTGSSNVVVGVIDSGIDATHPELSNCVDVYSSYDYVTGTGGQSIDPNGHGTHIAGIIAATHNSYGIAGVCPDVTLVSFRVFNENGVGYSSSVACAIDDAESMGIPILTMSAGWGTKHGEMFGILYAYALENKISDYDGLFVCAAGNDNLNLDSVVNIEYPAEYVLDNLISVGASTINDCKDDNSNYGSSTVDIFAPGSDILSCFPRTLCLAGNCTDSDTEICVATGYHSLSGTSMAAPYVTGVAALLLSIHPELTPEEIKEVILDTADPVLSLSDYCVCGGRLNAYDALSFRRIHNFSVTRYTVWQHKYSCSCGYSYYETHSWNALKTKCMTCGYDVSGSVVHP